MSECARRRISGEVGVGRGDYPRSYSGQQAQPCTREPDDQPEDYSPWAEAVSLLATSYVWDHSPMRGAPFTVHLAVADIANPQHDMQVWASIETLAKRCRLTRASVTRALARLVEAGQLEIVAERPGRTTLYRMLLPASGCGGSPDASVAGAASSVVGTRRTGMHERKRTEADNYAPLVEKPERNQAALDAIRSRFHG